MSPEVIEWEDLYRLELAIIKLELEELLRRQVWILRNKYEEIASTYDINDYALSNPPDISKCEEKELRTEATWLQEELNWRFTVMLESESFRGQIIKILFWGAAGLLIVIASLACFWDRITNGFVNPKDHQFFNFCWVITADWVFPALFHWIETVARVYLDFIRSKPGDAIFSAESACLTIIGQLA